MPLVAHNALPSFERLRSRGHNVLSAKRALHQDIRELHIGLLNMMPDAALSATEHQFIRLVGASNQIAQFYVYPFTFPELNRGPEALEHVREHYFEFEDLQEQGLDALMITGANVANPHLSQEAFWQPPGRRRRLGAGKRSLNTLLVPRYTCRGQFQPRHRTASLPEEKVGGVQSPDSQAGASAGVEYQYSFRCATLPLQRY